MRFALALSALAGLALAVPTTYPSCASGPVLQDPSFESGTNPSASQGNPWRVVHFIEASTYSLTQPGSPNVGGNYAFTAKLYPGARSGGLSGETLTQNMRTCAGQNYSITADYRFESEANNNCALKIEYPYKDTRGSVTTGSAISPAGVWYTTGSTFQAVSLSDRFDIVCSCSNGANNWISMDNVKILPYTGNAF